MVRTSYRNKGSKRNIVISIAGVHGIGKTTIFNLLKKELKNNRKFKFFPERYIKKPPFPFGSTDKQIAFRSEIHFLQQFIRRNKNIINFDSRYNGRIIILDRTPLCVLVYSKSLYLKEKDYKLIEDMYNSVRWREDYVFYLYAGIDTTLKRILSRGSLDKRREKWNEYERDYLKHIFTFYNDLLLQGEDRNKIISIDTECKNVNEILEITKQNITELTDYSFRKLIESSTSQMNIIKFLK
ncbi:MAG: deoxynucleoside kinase [Candidatus Lokiarchaeota archaeon]